MSKTKITKARARQVLRDLGPAVTDAALDVRRGKPGARDALLAAIDAGQAGPLVAVITISANGGRTLHRRCSPAQAERLAAELRARGSKVEVLDPRKRVK